MSGISKITATAALALAALTQHAQAQDQGPPPGAGNPSVSAARSADIRQEIISRVENLMKELATYPELRTKDGSLTISDIDKLNRSAERERTELEFEKARTERMKLELDRLMSLYDTVSQIEALERENARKTQQQDAEAATQDDEQEKDTPSQPAFDPLLFEQQNLPRVVSISGVGDDLKVEFAYPDNMIEILEEGRITKDDFVVEDINADRVILVGPASNSQYILKPEMPLPPQIRSRTQNIQDAIDMRDFPEAQF